LIENPEQYDKILFVDCDTLALRNIDHLLEGDWDIRYQPERGKPADGKSINAFLTEEELLQAA
jgi:alpha-N-acetylglucosamine transferase